MVHDETYREEHFVADGSLRDVVVLDVGMSEWQALVERISTSGWEHSLELTSKESVIVASLPAERIFELLRSDDEASARLAVRVGSVWFTSYFWDKAEIEFTFDPTQISNENAFRALMDFMHWLARITRKSVRMTMETTNHQTIPALVEVEPPQLSE